MSSHDKGLIEIGHGLLCSPARVDSNVFGSRQGPEERNIDPLWLLGCAMRYRWLIGATLLFGLVAGVAFTLVLVPVYRAQATVEILTDNTRALNELDLFAHSNDARALETQRNKMLSRDLSREVVSELDLSSNADFLGPRHGFSLQDFAARALGIHAKDSIINDYSAEQRERLAVSRLQSTLSAEFVRGTSILTVTFSHPDAELAAAVVNKVTERFIARSADHRGVSSQLAQQFASEQVDEIKGKLAAAEQKLLDYAKVEGILLNTSEISPITANIAAINNTLSGLQQDLILAELQIEQINAGGAAALPQIVESEAINTAKTRLSELRADYQQNLATLKPAFPEMRQLSAQITEVESQIERDIDALAQSINLNAEQLAERRETLQNELLRLEAAQADFQRKNVRYTILQRDVDSYRTQHDTLVATLNEVEVSADLRRVSTAVVDPAIIPRSPVSPDLPSSLLIALGISGFFSALIVYLLELTNNTYADPDTVENDLGLPVLGIIPATLAQNIERERNNPVSAYSEAYRTLRTSIRFSVTNKPIVTYAVTSSEPEEGKSTTVFTLAREFAGLNKRVLVIDADMRKSSMHRFFKTDNDVGLSNILANVLASDTKTPTFRKTGMHNVDFISAGTLPPNPVNLLASQCMALVAEFCADRYDIVLIDCPPVGGLADALILSRLADATLLVVSSKQAKRDAAKTAVKRLQAASANIIGVAMTKFEVDRFDYTQTYTYLNYDIYAYGEDSLQPAGSGRKKVGIFGGRFQVLYRQFVRDRSALS